MREIQQPSSLSGRDNYLAVITAPIIAFHHIHILYEHSIALVGKIKIIRAAVSSKYMRNITYSSSRP